MEYTFYFLIFIVCIITLRIFHFSKNYHNLFSRTTLIILFSIFFSQNSFAQYTAAQSFSSAQGLQGINHYSIFQDSKLNIWALTYGDGVDRYDGKKWEHWSKDKGMTNQGVNDMFEDKTGALWFGTEQCWERYHNGKFMPFFAGKELPTGSLFYDYNLKIPICVGKLPETYIFHFDYASNKFINTGKRFLSEKIPQPKKGRLAIYSNKGQPNKQYFIIHDYFKQQKFLYLNSNRTQKQIKLFNNIVFNDIAGIGGGGVGAGIDNYPVFHNNKDIFYIKEGAIKLLQKPTITTYGPTPDYSLLLNKACFDYSNNRLLSVWKVHSKQLVDTTIYLLAELDNMTMTWKKSVLFKCAEKPKFASKDKSGAYWIVTYQKLYRLYPWLSTIGKYEKNYMPETWNICQTGNKQIWLSSYGYGVRYFDGLGLHMGPKSFDPNWRFDDGSYRDEVGNIYFNLEAGSKTVGGILKIDKDGKKFEIGAAYPGFYFTKNTKGELLRGMDANKGLWKLPIGKNWKDTTQWEKYGVKKGFQLENILTISEDHKGRYWVGRVSTGLAVYDPSRDTFFNWLIRDNPKMGGVMSSSVDFKGNLWLGTTDGLKYLKMPDQPDGAFQMDSNLKTVGKQILGTSMVTVCKVYADTLLVIGNSKGVFVLDLAMYYSNPIKTFIRSFTENTGNFMGKVNQNSIWEDDDHCLWLVCSEGTLKLDPKLLPPSQIKDLSLHIDSILIDNKSNRFTKEPLELIYGSINECKIIVTASKDTSMISNTYYELRNTSTGEVKLFDKPELIFRTPFKTTGTFKAYLRVNRDGIYSDEVAITFKCSVWWLNPLFWLLVFSLIFGSTFYLWKKSNEMNQHKLELANQRIQLSEHNRAIAEQEVELSKLNKEKNKLQIYAIVNQLNPHFINNALQWLQVRVDEDEEAVKVVGKLSENISTVFRNSRNKKTYHSVVDEMKLTENYLYIQKQRFGSKLIYELPNQEELRKYAKINIPLLMIQIHVENAVEHGVRNKQDGNGSVIIKITDNDNYVFISVEDNGVGREEAGKIGSKGTQNGTKMLQEIQEIYNLQNQLFINQTYEDTPFVNELGKKYGTKVIIQIPKDYNFDLE